MDTIIMKNFPSFRHNLKYKMTLLALLSGIHGLKPVGTGPAQFRNLGPDQDRKIEAIQDQFGPERRKFKKFRTSSDQNRQNSKPGTRPDQEREAFQNLGPDRKLAVRGSLIVIVIQSYAAYDMHAIFTELNFSSSTLNSLI